MMILACLFTTVRLSAAGYQWDANGATSGYGGTGTWDTTGAFWDLTGTGADDGSDATQAVTFTAGDTATFGGTAGTVTLASGVVLGATNFTTGGYTLNLTNPAATTYAFGTVTGAPTVNVTLGAGATTATFGPTTNLAAFTGVLNIGVSQAAASGKASINSTAGPLPASATVNVTANSTLYAATALTHAASVTLNGGDTGESLGQLRIETAGIWSGNVTLNGVMAAGDSFIGSNSTTGTFSGNIGESGGSRILSKGGSGTTVLSGTNSFTGGTVVNAGTLRLDYTTNNTNKLPDTAGVTLAAASTLRFTGNASATTTEVVNGLTLNGSSSLALDTAAGQTLTADFTGSGAGVYTSNNHSLFVTTTGAGTAQIKLPGTAASTNLGPYVIYNSTFAATDANSYLIGTSSVNNTATALATWASGATTYTTTGSAFTGSVGSIGIDGITFNDAAARTVAIGAANVVTLSKGIIVSPGVGANVSTISGGSIQAPNGGVLIANNGNASSSLTISSAIVNNGSSSLLKTGAGTVVLSGTNTFAGGITVDLGTLSATGPSALGSGTITAGANTFYATAYASGGAPFLAVTGAGTQVVPNNIVLPNAPSTRYYAIQKAVAAGSTLELGGVISGGGANTFLQLDSPNAGDSTTHFILSGANTLSGQVRLNRGSVTLPTASALGTASLFVQTNPNATDGNVRFTNSLTLSNNVIVGSTASNVFNTNANDIVLSGAFTSGATWNKIGAGSLTLSNTNSGAGGINVNAGTLVVSGISSATGSITVTGATMKVTGTIYANAFNTAVLTVGSAATLELANWSYDQSTAHTTSLGGLRANNPSFVVNGGTVRIVGTTATSYTRGFSVGANGATFEAAAGANWTLASGGADATLVAAYTGNPSLTFTGAGIGEFGKIFSGTGGLVKSGTGTWTLGGANTYSGTTTVSGGTLLVNGANSGTGAVSVASTATLGGTGSIAGAVTVNSGAFLAPGTTGAGTLTVASATLAGTYNCQLDDAAADKIAVTGILTLSPGAAIAVSTVTAPTANSFTIATYGTLSGPLPTVTGIPAGYVLDTSTTGQIKLTKGGYAGWAAGFPGLTNTAPDADPDNDGIPNLMEYVLGGDPRLSSTSILPTFKVDSTGGLLLTFSRNPDSIAETTLTVEWDTDLSGGFANSIPIGTVDVEPSGSNAAIDVDAPTVNSVMVYIPWGNAADGKLFARLRVSRP